MSDWKEDSNKRRDERHTKIDDSGTGPAISQKKDKKKWCKGKVGKEHKTEVRKYSEVKKIDMNYCVNWKILICTVCGKELDVWFTRKNKPDWAK